MTNDEDDEDICTTCLASGLDLMIVEPVMPLRAEISVAYESDDVYASILAHFRSPSDKTLEALPRTTRSHIARYQLDGGLLAYSIDCFDAPRVWCQMTLTCARESFTSSTMPQSVGTWAAKRLSLQCRETSTSPICTSGRANGCALVRSVNG